LAQAMTLGRPVNREREPRQPGCLWRDKGQRGSKSKKKNNTGRMTELTGGSEFVCAGGGGKREKKHRTMSTQGRQRAQ